MAHPVYLVRCSDMTGVEGEADTKSRPHAVANDPGADSACTLEHKVEGLEAQSISGDVVS